MVRIRKTPFQIGRTVGNARIVHDEMIADPHVEIVWTKDKLHVRNLTAQASLFERVARATLSVGQVIRIGQTRYQYGDPGELMPLDSRDGPRWIPLKDNKVWVGRDPGLGGIVVKDAAADLRHACLARDGSGKWRITDNGSLNGTWISVPEIVVENVAEFFLGEQGFRLEIPLNDHLAK